MLEDQTVVVAHCANTGSMKSCSEPGSTIWLSRSDDPRRKLAYSWECTQTSGGGIGVHTGRPNELLAESLVSGHRPVELSGYPVFKREVSLPGSVAGKKSRLDFLLSGHPELPDLWLEVKNSTFLLGDSVIFPDAVSERARRHLAELVALVARGFRAVLFFVVNRPDGSCMRGAQEIDPEYARELFLAHRAGVEILAYRTANTLHSSILTSQAVPLDWHFWQS